MIICIRLLSGNYILSEGIMVIIISSARYARVSQNLPRVHDPYGNLWLKLMMSEIWNMQCNIVSNRRSYYGRQLLLLTSYHPNLKRKASSEVNVNELLSESEDPQSRRTWDDRHLTICILEDTEQHLQGLVANACVDLNCWCDESTQNIIINSFQCKVQSLVQC